MSMLSLPLRAVHARESRRVLLQGMQREVNHVDGQPTNPQNISNLPTQFSPPFGGVYSPALTASEQTLKRAVELLEEIVKLEIDQCDKLSEIEKLLKVKKK